MPDLSMPDEDLGIAVQMDFNAARDTRQQQLENRMFQRYKLFRKYRDDVQGGGQDDYTQPGPFGWSKITIGLCYDVVMEALARTGTEVPMLQVSADDPASEPYAQAKELELRYLMERGCWGKELRAAARDAYVYGMNPVKTIWDDHLGGPRAFAVWWWDFFISPEASSFEDAEYLAYRSWHTPAAIERMKAMKDDKNRNVFRNLDAVHGAMGPDRDGEDNYWSQIRTVQGIGPMTPAANQVPMTPVTEVWYRDGSIVTVAGGTYAVVISKREAAPYLHVMKGEVDGRKHHCFLDDGGQPFRPFASICPIPDNGSPYGISMVELVEDHQRELSTLRNQYIDQMTQNLNSPIGVNRELADPAEVLQAFRQPGGQFAMDGPPDQAVHRFAPGDLPRDMSELHQIVIEDAERTTGMHSLMEGRPESPGLVNESPLGFAMRIGEQNKRRQLEIANIMDGVIDIAHHFDWLNRSVNSGSSSTVPIPDGYKLSEEAEGITRSGPGRKWGKIGNAVNEKGRSYCITIDTSSMIPSYKGQRAMEITSFVEAINNVDQLAQIADWPEIMRKLAEAFDLDPEEMMLSPDEMEQQDQEDQQDQQGQDDSGGADAGQQQDNGQQGGNPVPGEPGGPPAPPGAVVGQDSSGQGYTMLPHGPPEEIPMQAPPGAAPGMAPPPNDQGEGMTPELELEMLAAQQQQQQQQEAPPTEDPTLQQ